MPSVPIVVFAGQSNANNGASIDAIFDYVAANDALMVQAAINGAPLAQVDDGLDWSTSSNELLADLFDLLDPLFDPTSPHYVPGAYLDAVIWSQGGADIYSNARADAYQDNLTALILALQNRYGVHDFVISGMADSSFIGRGLTGQLAINWHKVQDAQQAVDAMAHVILLDPDTVASAQGFGAAQMYQWDYIHYSNAFGGALGTALAQQILPAGGAIDSARYLAGTSGDDTVTVAAAGLVQVYGNEGSDTLLIAPTGLGLLLQDQGFTTTRITDRAGGDSLHLDLISIEAVVLGNNGDEARLAGVTPIVNTRGGADKVIGSAADEVAILGNGNDYAALLEGADYINGGNGRDTILGGAGNDRLIGGTGDDVINGGADNDRMTGGAGADQFVFWRNQGVDTITDFVPGLDDLVFTGGASWADVSITAHGSGAAVIADGTLIYLLNATPAQLTADDFIFQ